MPQPTVKDVHIDAPLTNISIAAMNSESAFIAEKVFPSVPVKKESDKYYVFSKSHLFRSEVEKRAPSAAVRHRGYELSNDSYLAEEYATGILVPDRVAENSDDPLKPYEDATKIISHDMMMFKENNFAAEHLVAGSWTTDNTLSGNDQWSDYVNSDPVTAMETAKYTVARAIGKAPQELSIAMGSAVYQQLKRHPKMIELFGGGNANFKILNNEQVALVLGVKEVLVSEAIWNVNNEGNSTQTLSNIVANNCLVFYKPDSPSLMTESAGYFMMKTQSEIVRYYNQRKRSQAVEITSLFDFKLTDADAGYLFVNAVA